MIRRAQPRDVPAVEQLLADANLPALKTSPVQLFVAEEKGTLQGAVGLEPYPPYALLRSLVVTPNQRGKGLGRALLMNALKGARAQGFDTVYGLTTTISGWLERLGFQRVERSAIPEPVHASDELGDACPESALAYERNLNPRYARGVREGGFKSGKL